MNLPVELFLQIIKQIDRPKDLLSLALVNRPLFNTIIPDHIDYRQIWCEIDEHDVWDHLLKQRSRCKAVRALNVDAPEKRYIPRQCCQQVPVDLAGRTDIDTPDVPAFHFPRRLLSQRKFYEALSRMSNLKTLRCVLSDEEIITNISNAISRARCALEELSVEVGQSQYQEWTESNPFKLEIISPHMYSISKLLLVVRPFVRLGPNSIMEILSDMPNLTHLRLVCPTIPMPKFLTTGRWPRLKSLNLQASTLREEGEDEPAYSTRLRAFFTYHSLLESLNFIAALVPGCMQQSEENADVLLPHLASFRNDHATTCPIGNILPISVSQRLTHLTVTLPHETLNLKPNALVALKTCELWCDEGGLAVIENLVQAAPNVEKLCIHYKRFSLSVPDILQRLLPLKKLVELLGLFNNISLSDQQGVALLRELYYEFPSLSYIHVRVGNEHGRAHLSQNHLRKAMDYEILPLVGRLPYIHLDWGNFF